MTETTFYIDPLPDEHFKGYTDGHTLLGVRPLPDAPHIKRSDLDALIAATTEKIEPPGSP